MTKKITKRLVYKAAKCEPQVTLDLIPQDILTLKGFSHWWVETGSCEVVIYNKTGEIFRLFEELNLINFSIADLEQLVEHPCYGVIEWER